MSEELPNNKDKKKSWLVAFVKNARETKDGDIIAGEVGENTSSVAIGKNIIQIGSIEIPRYLAVVLVIGMVIVAVAAVRLLYLFLPETVMPDSTFNIAIAELTAFDEAGQPINEEEARKRAQSIANFVSEQADTLTEIINQKVVVWGPDYGVSPIQIGKEAAHATELNANVLIYGNLQKVGQEQWKLEPRFYLTEDAINQAQELAGEHALGRQLTYSNKVSGIGKVNAALRMRMEALSKLIYGLSLMTDYNAEGYHEASAIFQDIADNSEWAKAGDKSGQEILQLFLGNAYLAEAQLINDGSPERDSLLEKSKTAFLAAVALNPAYARSYNGLGSVNFQLARNALAGDECNWRWSLLDEAEQAYNNALQAPSEQKPISGQVDFRSHFGLGRVHYTRGYCENEVDSVTKKWKIAEADYQFVLDMFNQMSNPLPIVANIAAFAHSDLAAIALYKSGFPNQPDTDKLLQESIIHYKQMFQLLYQSKTAEGWQHGAAVMPNYLSALCIAGQGKEAMIALDEFIDTVPDGDGLRENILVTLNGDNPDYWKDCSNV